MGDAIKSSAEVKVASLEFEPDSASARIRELWREEPTFPEDYDDIELIEELSHDDIEFGDDEFQDSEFGDEDPF